MVNTYLDIRLKDEGGKKKIDVVYFCTNKGRRRVDAVDALCRNTNIGVPQYITFGFSNICYNYPYRIIIADECCPPSGEYEWYNRANFNLMYAYYRLTQMLGDSLPPRIDYSYILYGGSIYVIKGADGIQTLVINKSNLTIDEYYDNGNFSGNPDSLLLFPILFKKGVSYHGSSEPIDSYYAYNPPRGFDIHTGTSTSISEDLYYFVSEGVCKYRNEPLIVNGSETEMNFPLYVVNTGNQIWNIDLDKLNIGYEVARYVESY